MEKLLKTAKVFVLNKTVSLQLTFFNKLVKINSNKSYSKWLVQ